MSERAVEAAARAHVKMRYDNIVRGPEEYAAGVIRAYLAALAEDDAAVEKVARAIWDDKEPDTRVWEDKHEIMKDEWRRTARAAIRALGE